MKHATLILTMLTLCLAAANLAPANSPQDTGMLPGRQLPADTLTGITQQDDGEPETIMFPGVNHEMPMKNPAKVEDHRPEQGGANRSLMQIISAPEGWSGISAYIIPDDPDIENLFAPMLDRMDILY